MAERVDSASARPEEASFITVLSRRLTEVASCRAEIDGSEASTIRDGALEIEDDAIDALKGLIGTSPARSLSDAAVQVALAHAAAHSIRNGADAAICDKALAVVERLTASVLLQLLDTEGVQVDLPAIRRHVLLDHWRGVWGSVVI